MQQSNYFCQIQLILCTCQMMIVCTCSKYDVCWAKRSYLRGLWSSGGRQMPIQKTVNTHSNRQFI